METRKAGRPAITDESQKKKAYMVSLTPKEANKIVKKHKSLTRAILTLIKPKGNAESETDN